MIISIFITSIHYINKLNAYYFPTWTYDFENETIGTKDDSIYFIDEFSGGGASSYFIIADNPDDSGNNTLYGYDVHATEDIDAKHYILNHSYINNDYYYSFKFKKIDLVPDTIPQQFHNCLMDTDNNYHIIFSYFQNIGGVNEKLRYYNNTNPIDYYFDVQENWHLIEIYCYISNKTYSIYMNKTLLNSGLEYYTAWNDEYLDYIWLFSDEEIKIYLDDFTFSSLEEQIIEDSEKEVYPMYSYFFENEVILSKDESINFVDDITISGSPDLIYTQIRYNENDYGNKSLYIRDSWSMDYLEFSHYLENYSIISNDFKFTFAFRKEEIIPSAIPLFINYSIFDNDNNMLLYFGYETDLGDLNSRFFYNNGTNHITYLYDLDDSWHSFNIYGYLSSNTYNIYIDNEILGVQNSLYTNWNAGYIYRVKINTDEDKYIKWHMDNYIWYSLINPIDLPIPDIPENPSPLIDAMIYIIVRISFILLPVFLFRNQFKKFDDKTKRRLYLLLIFAFSLIMFASGMIPFWIFIIICFTVIAFMLEEMKEGI